MYSISLMYSLSIPTASKSMMWTGVLSDGRNERYPRPFPPVIHSVSSLFLCDVGGAWRARVAKAMNDPSLPTSTRHSSPYRPLYVPFTREPKVKRGDGEDKGRVWAKRRKLAKETEWTACVTAPYGHSSRLPPFLRMPYRYAVGTVRLSSLTFLSRTGRADGEWL